MAFQELADAEPNPPTASQTWVGHRQSPDWLPRHAKSYRRLITRFSQSCARVLASAYGKDAGGCAFVFLQKVSSGAAWTSILFENGRCGGCLLNFFSSSRGHNLEEEWKNREIPKTARPSVVKLSILALTRCARGKHAILRTRCFLRY